ncbi:MAG: (d)CMP kinase [Pseudomonadota bacterium]
MENIPVITVDGPGGAGKGTISQILARELGWGFLDSGALYRLLALASDWHGIEVENEAALETLAAHLDVHFEARDDGEPARIVLEGEDVTEAIRNEEIGARASEVAALPVVRQALLDRQRDFRKPPGLIADGRDMGTVVFPEAPLKLFLTASAEERARRRYIQLSDKGLDVNLARLAEEIRERDRRDSERSVSPLKPAEDAITIDTTEMDVDQVIAEVERLCHQRLGQEVPART